MRRDEGIICEKSSLEMMRQLTKQEQYVDLLV